MVTEYFLHESWFRENIIDIQHLKLWPSEVIIPYIIKYFAHFKVIESRIY